MLSYFNPKGALEGIPTFLVLAVTKAGLAVSCPAATFVLYHMLQGHPCHKEHVSQPNSAPCSITYCTRFLFLSLQMRELVMGEENCSAAVKVRS